MTASTAGTVRRLRGPRDELPAGAVGSTSAGAEVNVLEVGPARRRSAGT
ncbi:hypothetical protein [Streptomyces sp. NPDC048248]